MKDINEIEEMTTEALEAASKSDTVIIPSGLRKSLETALFAEELKNVQSNPKHKPFLIWGPALVAAAAGLSVLFYVANTPKDTFSDPEEAYAQLERTFRYMQSKAEMVNDITENAFNLSK